MIYKQTGNGRWVTHLGFERGNAIVEAQQRYVGRPWSGWAGTNVVERFVGLRFRISPQGRIYNVWIKSNGNHATSWAHPATRFNDRDRWHNDFAPVPPGVYYNVWVSGDVTEVHLEAGLNAEYVDFYHPRKNNTSICKGK